MKIKIPILTQMNQATIMKYHHLINRNRIKILKMTQDQLILHKMNHNKLIQHKLMFQYQLILHKINQDHLILL